MKYRQEYDNEWIQPIRKGYKMMCCDCGLVHDVDFKLVKHGRGHKILYRATRNNRATGQGKRKHRRA